MAFGKIIGEAMAGGASKLIDSVGSIVDNIHTSETERGEIKAKFTNIVADYFVDSEDALTERLKYDTQNGNTLSRSVRPLSLIFLLGVITLLAFTDGNIGEFTVKESYIDLYKNLLGFAFTFYFGGRSAEKIAKVIGNFRTEKLSRAEKKANAKKMMEG